MKPITLSELQQLHDIEKSNCVSIYIPTHRAGVEVHNYNDAKLLKNNTHNIRKSLEKKGWNEEDAYKFLDPVYKLTEDTGFWHHQLDGLAIFRSDEIFKYYRLPFHVNELNLLSSKFHLKPLLESFSHDYLYYILALSLDKIRLLEANEYAVHELNLEEIFPEGVNEILSFYDFQQSLQMRSQQVGTTGDDKIYHGHGSAKKDDTPYIKEYFRKVNDALSRFFTSSTPTPLVLAGVDYLLPLYKEVNTNADIVDEGITGNPNALKPEELHADANKIMKPNMEKKLKQRQQKYEQLAGSGKTSYNIEEIVKASVNGRVEAVFVAKDSYQWGKIEVNGEPKVEIHNQFQENDQDLYDISAVKTILNSGEAYFVDKENMPEKSVDANIAAVFRY